MGLIYSYQEKIPKKYEFTYKKVQNRQSFVGSQNITK